MEKPMRSQTFQRAVLGLTVFLFSHSPLLSQAGDAPANVAAALLVKAAAFERRTAGGGDVSVYVLGGRDVAAELKKGTGQALGASVLKTVQEGADLPSAQPTILFIGDKAKAADAIAYCRTRKVMSAAASPDLVKKGVSLGFGISGGGSPEIWVNLKASLEEGLDWNPALMKVAKTVQ
jgi:hypothetical protein